MGLFLCLQLLSEKPSLEVIRDQRNQGPADHCAHDIAARALEQPLKEFDNDHILLPNADKISYRPSAARWLPVGLRVCSRQRDAPSLLAASHS